MRNKINLLVVMCRHHVSATLYGDKSILKFIYKYDTFHYLFGCHVSTLSKGEKFRGRGDITFHENERMNSKMQT